MKVPRKSGYCRHGNRRALGICPECANSDMKRRQQRADRALFKEQLVSIRGPHWRPMS